MSVTVVGSLNEDVIVTVPALPGRGETVIGTAVQILPGGKGANQAAAAGRLAGGSVGGRGGTPGGVAMVGRVGDDDAGARQLAALRSAGVDVGLVLATADVPTGSATIPVEAEGGENLIVVVPGANSALTPADVQVPVVREARVLVLQLETPVETVLAAARHCTGTVLLNPAPARKLPTELLAEVDVLVPNEHELSRLAPGVACDGGDAALVEAARSLAARDVVVTLGARGALVVPADGDPFVQAPPPVDAVDTTGAGDCFCGALAMALSGGAPGGGAGLAEAVRYAVTAAALSTTGSGARGGYPDDGAVRDLLADTPAAKPVRG